MKTTVLQGSPRKKGNTAQIIEWIEDELISLGHEVESIYLNSKNIHGCLACGKCKEKNKSIVDTKDGIKADKAGKNDIIDQIGCVQKDDAPAILEKMVGSELVIFASPLYFWGFTAQLKALIDRTYSLYTNYHKPDHASLVKGQRQALLLTGGGSYENNAEAVFTAFSRMQNPHKAIKSGELFVGNCTTADMLDISVKQQAIEFARKITA
ncbi:MAG: flavodoxin family protein [Desulfamplus sp.]|nr:flavodoxin family protein [Desulfamplus sp.]